MTYTNDDVARGEQEPWRSSRLQTPLVLIGKR